MDNKNFVGHENASNSVGVRSGVFSGFDFSSIQNVSGRITDLLDPEAKELYLYTQSKLNELIPVLQTEVKNISDEIGYRYYESDYINRLFYETKRVLSQKDLLLQKYPNLNKILDDILFLFPDNFKISIEEKIFNSILLDVVYESFNSKKYSVILPDGRDFKILKDIYSLIDKLHENDKNYLKLEHEDLFKIFSTNYDELFKLIKYAGNHGIKILNLGQTKLNEVFSNNPNSFIKFIEIVGSSGIKSIDLGMGKLEDIFSNNPRDFIEFIRFAGLSGIRVLNLTGNRVAKIFNYNTSDFILFIKTAGESGVKNLGLWLSGVGDIFIDHPEHLIDMVDVAGKSGIRILRLNSCGFTDTFQGHMQLLRDFLKACEESEVKSINLGNNHLNKYDEHIKDIDKIIEKIMKGK